MRLVEIIFFSLYHVIFSPTKIIKGDTFLENKELFKILHQKKNQKDFEK